ncbi:MAG: retroviral-like aspartic protease family protein [Phormidesmis sp. CAN_BIN44]|nr:retroviral-like aspartic protease family protein [Phormidesmis sp. CAN_BIN44]
MLKLSRSGISLLFAGVLSLNGWACSRDSLNQGTSAPPKSSPVAAASPAAKSVKEPQSEAYQLAIDKAQSAKSMSQSVQSADDWKLVASRWQQAIALLKQVPKADPNKKFANQKLAEYQRSLALAQSRADQTGRDRGETLESKIVVDTPLTDAMREANASGVGGGGGSYRAPIKYRQSRIPVIDVLFNGSRQFDMMVDTGASGTMITPDMAKALGAKTIGTTTGMTPAGRIEVAVVMLQSIRVGTRIIRNVPVVIGPVRLLGHDFFGSCDLTIKQETIEFQQCAG